jgi:hypothetical protein
MLFLADESGEPALVNLEIPLAEAIKRIDPAVRIMCNASTILSDEHLSTRLFKAFDLFQPHLDYDLVHEWLRQSGKPLWVYQCQTDLPPMGIDLYSYYRVCVADARSRICRHGVVDLLLRRARSAVGRGFSGVPDDLSAPRARPGALTAL